MNGYGVIGKRVADAVTLQPDMELVGVADTATDYRLRLASERNYPLFGSTPEAVGALEDAGFGPVGGLQDLLRQVDVVVDATPKNIGAANAPAYAAEGVKAIFQGGEKHELAGVSFVAQANYEEALGRDSVRVVSCNTTGLVRVLSALRDRSLLARARGVLIRRGTDPWESHAGGLINTLAAGGDHPLAPGTRCQDGDPGSRPGDDRRGGTVQPVPRPFPRRRGSPRDRPGRSPGRPWGGTADRLRPGIRRRGGPQLGDRDRSGPGRPRADLWEVALWEDTLAVSGREVFLTYQVHNEAIVIPENVDAIRAITAEEPDGAKSIAATDESLGIRQRLP